MDVKTDRIEPALLTIFRWFVGLRIVYSVLLIVINVFLFREPPEYSLVLGLATFIGLLLYLFSSWTQQHLGDRYLPLALVVMTLTLILSREMSGYPFVIQGVQIAAIPSTKAVDNAIGTVVSALTGSTPTDASWVAMVFVPLVLTAWQYDFRRVIWFIIGVNVFYMLLYVLPLQEMNIGIIKFALILLSRSLTLGVVGYVVASLAGALKQQRAALRDTNLHLINHLAVQEQLTTSQERNRLARELHDTLAHSLSATTIQLEASTALWEINPAKAHDLLNRALLTTRAGLTETRRALEALRASPLEDLGLLLSLRQLATESAQRSGYQLDLKLPPALEALPQQTEQTIYRCAQEMLANIARHAAAQRVQLQLDQRDGHIDLTIKDDGRGFDPPAVDRSKSFGLVGMKERIEMLGGWLDVTSQPGQGTTIHLRLGTAP